MHYDQKYYQQTAGVDMSGSCDKFLNKLEGSRILDLGCGSGRDSNYFKQAGYQVTSVDPSDEAVKYAAKQYGLEVIRGSLETGITGQFDGVWACACFVHHNLEQLTLDLTRLKHNLKPSSIVYISLKYGAGQIISNDQTYYLYDESLSNILEGLGYRIIEVAINGDKMQRNVGWIEYIVQPS